MYTINNFSFSYPFSKSRLQLNGCVHINAHDKILIQGDSGSGKSTLLLALAGIIPHLINGSYSGDIIFKNKKIHTHNLAELNQIGYLGQNQDHQLVCNLVEDELAFGLENQGISPEIIKSKIDDLSAKSGVSHLLKTPVNQLSGGEKQKINLLSIILMNPEIILLDEPTAFLDPDSAIKFMNTLNELCHDKTIIIIEHNIAYLKDIINRSILVTKTGEIIEQAITDIKFNKTFESMACRDSLNNLPQVLKIKQLQYNYKGSETLLNNINLELRKGQIIGIIGSNGSGKSTLLKLISNVLKNKDSIFFEDKDIATIKRTNYWQKISLVWQNPENHFLHNTVLEELENNESLIKYFNLPHNTNPFRLSEGQKRRLSLAICFKKDVDIFLLDEPTFGQDDINKKILSQLISDLAINAKKSFIIVSHDLSFIHSLTKDIYKLEHKKLIPLHINSKLAALD